MLSRAPTFWARNTWHRVKASTSLMVVYGKDEMRLFLDGYEWNNAHFGQFLIGTTPFVAGSAMPGDGYFDGYSNQIMTSIILKDPINDLFIGTDYMGNNPVFSLVDNLNN